MHDIKLNLRIRSGEIPEIQTRHLISKSGYIDLFLK